LISLEILFVIYQEYHENTTLSLSFSREHAKNYGNLFTRGLFIRIFSVIFPL